MLKKWLGKKDRPEEKQDEPEPAGETAAGKRSPWSLLKGGLTKTRKGLKSLFTIRRNLDEAFIDELESDLYGTDFGPRIVEDLLNGEDGVRRAWKEKKIENPDQVREYLKGLLKRVLLKRDNRLVSAPSGPTVILVAGVNGTGKTTSIAKLASLLRQEGHSVILAAADTFRAAAVEQLTIWSERLGIEIVTGQAKADPGSVAYRAAQAALEKEVDFLIVDTAGRLHTQQNLMRELTKIRTVLGKKVDGAPHESLLVLDATTGQNALSQARSFLQAIQVTGIILAKLDGTAKGGIVVTINNELDIPVKFVGIGEKLQDLEIFDADAFVDALLGSEQV